MAVPCIQNAADQILMKTVSFWFFSSESDLAREHSICGFALLVDPLLLLHHHLLLDGKLLLQEGLQHVCVLEQRPILRFCRSLDQRHLTPQS